MSALLKLHEHPVIKHVLKNLIGKFLVLFAVIETLKVSKLVRDAVQNVMRRMRPCTPAAVSRKTNADVDRL